MTDLAIKKLEAEFSKGAYDKYAAIMKQGVKDTLEDFCRKNEEFAQAVYQGSSFDDCMKTVAKNCGTGISDLEAYRRAVRFYFPGADIKFHMSVNLCASVERPEDDGISTDAQQVKSDLIDLTEFL